MLKADLKLTLLAYKKFLTFSTRLMARRFIVYWSIFQISIGSIQSLGTESTCVQNELSLISFFCSHYLIQEREMVPLLSQSIFSKMTLNQSQFKVASMLVRNQKKRGRETSWPIFSIWKIVQILMLFLKMESFSLRTIYLSFDQAEFRIFMYSKKNPLKMGCRQNYSQLNRSSILNQRHPRRNQTSTASTSDGKFIGCLKSAINYYLLLTLKFIPKSILKNIMPRLQTFDLPVVLFYSIVSGAEYQLKVGQSKYSIEKALILRLAPSRNTEAGVSP